MITEAQLGWAAAVFDMKATFFRKENQDRATSQIVMIVDTSKYEVIEKLTEMTGGDPEKAETKKEAHWTQRACATHCPDKHVHHEVTMKATKRWSATNSALAIVLHNVIPYTAAAKPYREFYAEAMTTAVTAGRGSGAVRASTLRYLRLGWKVPDQMLAGLFPDIDPAFAQQVLASATT